MRRMADGGPAWGIIVAAGRSTRMDGVDKVYAELLGRPLVAWTLSAFRRCTEVERLVVVAAPERVAQMEDLVREWRLGERATVVAGGAERRHSVRAGLDAATGAALVAVHDGARPLVTPELIAQGVALARESGAAVCGIPARDTVKDVGGEPPVVRATIDRARAWLAQTPQVFDRDLLLRAHDAAPDAAVTDDAALVERLPHDVRMYVGAMWNLKVTSREDLVVAEALLRARLDALAR